MWPIIWQMRRFNKSIATKIQYENPVKGNSILINESVCSQKNNFNHVLFMFLYRLFSFISISEVSILDIKFTFFFPTYYFKY